MSIEDTPEVDVETVTSNVGDKCHGTINQAFSWKAVCPWFYIV